MAGMKTSPSLVNYFIYNSTFGPKEGQEHQKIVLYIPAEEDLDKKIKNVGLCEALVKFTQTFSPTKPCEALHTQKTRQVFYEAEPEFWMVMTVSVPFSEKITKDGKKITEYHDEDVLDSVLGAVLRQSYKMFKLFHGTFSYLLKTYNIEQLCKRTELFFTRYLQTLNFNQFDLMDVFSGIQFLPLDKNTFLKVQSFINLIEHTFSQVKYTAFLFNDKLVWSGLEQDDMRIMYKYLVTSLFPTVFDAENDTTKTQGYVVVMPKSHPGRFITGHPDIPDYPQPRKSPRLFINTDSEQEELYLVVYKEPIISMKKKIRAICCSAIRYHSSNALDATICLLMSGPFLTVEGFRKIDAFIGPQLTTLANVIAEQSSKSATEQQYRYIYFNQINLAQKSSVHSRKSSQSSVAPEIMRLLTDMSDDFSSSQEEGETFVKTMSDCWVVGRKSDQREFYVILNQKNANLIEINEEVKKLSVTHFNNIFFLD